MCLCFNAGNKYKELVQLKQFGKRVETKCKRYEIQIETRDKDWVGKTLIHTAREKVERRPDQTQQKITQKKSRKGNLSEN